MSAADHLKSRREGDSDALAGGSPSAASPAAAHPRPTWLPLVAALAIAVLAGAGLSVLGRRADAGLRMETTLERIGRRAQELNSLEWEALHVRNFEVELSERVAAVRGAMRGELGLLVASGLPEVATALRRYEVYLGLVDREFELLRAGEFGEAEQWDEAEVDPAFRELARALDEAGRQLDVGIVATLKWTRMGTLLLLFFGAFAIGALSMQFHSRLAAARAAEAKRREVELREMNNNLDRLVAERTRELRGSEARSGALIEQMSDGFIVVDQDDIIRFVNPQVCRMLGYAATELIGQHAGTTLLREGDRATIAEQNRRRAEGVAGAYEIELRLKSGRFLWCRLSATPVTDAADRFAGSMTIVTDITARKRAEAAILEEKAFSEAMLDSLPGVVCLFDRTGRLLRWNHAFENLSGYSATEIAAMHLLDFFTGEDRALVETCIRKVFESGAAAVEAALGSTTGKAIPHYFVWTRISWRGAPCCIGAGVDVTGRKHLESELHQAQKLEAIGRLAGGVAHDFNNLLGVILGYSELALNELPAESPVSEQLGEIVKAAQRAAALTRQLQAFSRKQVLQPRLLDLNALVAEARKMMVRLIGEDIAVTVRPAPDLGMVKADPGQIEQILLNLAVNARDAMPLGGNLTIETADLELDAAQTAVHPPMTPGRYIMLAVSDSGAGMDEATRERIFEPFFTTKTAGQGTGLGLATVYGIVKQSGGFIWVASAPGQGSTFKIYLPRVEAPAATARPADPPARASRGSETILVVEDSPALAATIRLRLEAGGYAVWMAGDGEEALALYGARAAAIDLLLTDVVMPNLGGGELARRFEALRPGLRVVFMSGYSDGVISHHGVLAPGVVLLEKPFTGDLLERVVRASLDAPGAAPDGNSGDEAVAPN